jgi:hypothetical protein
MREPSKVKWPKVIIGLICTILFVFIVAAGILASSPKTDDYLRDMIVKHSDFVDPSSAMFRNITYSPGSANLGLWDTYCGEINAKNRMGGYVGWKPFHLTVHKDGKVFVILLELKEIPFGASASMQERIEKLNMMSTEIYKSTCQDAQPAPSSVPFWKAF